MVGNDADQLSNVNGLHSVAGAHRNHKLQQAKQPGGVSTGQARNVSYMIMNWEDLCVCCLAPKGFEI